eukprot:2196672-Amphidinium_carterae.1
MVDPQTFFHRIDQSLLHVAQPSSKDDTLRCIRGLQHNPWPILKTIAQLWPDERPEIQFEQHLQRASTLQTVPRDRVQQCPNWQQHQLEAEPCLLQSRPLCLQLGRLCPTCNAWTLAWGAIAEHPSPDQKVRGLCKGIAPGKGIRTLALVGAKAATKAGIAAQCLPEPSHVVWTPSLRTTAGTSPISSHQEQ